MHLPAAFAQITRYPPMLRRPYPPLGFVAFEEAELGNGDQFGLYWPIGREQSEPIVAETWHDDGRLQPSFSRLEMFLAAVRAKRGGYPDQPTLVQDPDSPRASFEAARQRLSAQEFDGAIVLLERAIALLPEYTEALALLWMQYVRVGRTDDALALALRAIVAPPSLGAPSPHALRWLRMQPDPGPFADDPIWQMRDRLTLAFGGAKENPDYALLLDAIRTYLDRSDWVRASLLMQAYAERMFGETISFQKRHAFDAPDFVAWQIEVSANLPGGPRTLEI